MPNEDAGLIMTGAHLLVHSVRCNLVCFVEDLFDFSNKNDKLKTTFTYAIGLSLPFQ